MKVKKYSSRQKKFEKQVRLLFAGEKLFISWNEQINGGIIKLNRNLTRLELTNLFSLGVEFISGTNDGLLIAFLLDKD